MSRVQEIEQQYGVKVLYCCVMGSRAWGYASPDSDYDYRFVFVRPQSEYLRVSRTPDMQIECGEYVGWDLRKFLSLILKSNIAPFEWLEASDVLFECPGFRNKVLAIARLNRSTACAHYRNLAKSNWKKYIDGKDSVKQKKYIHVCRALLSSIWCERYDGMPPQNVASLTGLFDNDTQAAVFTALLTAKRSGAALPDRRVSELDKFIEATLSCKQHTGALSAQPTPEFFDSLFSYYATNF